MLVAHHLGFLNGAPGYRDRFQTAINQLGFPELGGVRRVAMANGSLGGIKQLGYNGQGQASGCQEALNFKLRTGQTAAATLGKLFFGFLYRGPLGVIIGGLSSLLVTLTTASIHFTPDYGGYCEVFNGYAFTKGSASVSVTGRPSSCGYDVAPGGYRSTQQSIVEEGPKKGDLIPNAFLRFVLAGQYLVPEYKNVLSNHAFIPTVSALALTNPNRDLAENLSTRNLVCSQETPFDAYYAPLTLNEEHVTLNPQNVTFITDEILRQTPTPVIVGNVRVICTNGGVATYRIKEDCLATRSGATQPATTYSWTIGPNLTLLSGQGTASITVRRVGTFDGRSTVQVTVTRAGFAPATAALSVKIGSPDEPGIQTLEPLDGCANLVGRFQVYDFDSALSYFVTATGSLRILGNGINTDGTFSVKGGGRGGVVRVQATNSCGTATTLQGFTFYGCPGDARPGLYPNPADSFVELLLSTESASLVGLGTPAESSAKTTPATPTNSSVNVTVYNGQGRVQYQAERVTAPSLRLDTTTWPNGLYQVVRHQAGKITRQQLSIQH